MPSWELTVIPHDADNSIFDQPSVDGLIPLREAAGLSGLSASPLRLLVSRGDIWGLKVGRNWATTSQAVEKYLAQDRWLGPKPKKPRS
jgi:hypothetical protein